MNTRTAGRRIGLVAVAALVLTADPTAAADAPPCPSIKELPPRIVCAQLPATVGTQAWERSTPSAPAPAVDLVLVWLPGVNAGDALYGAMARAYASRPGVAFSPVMAPNARSPGASVNDYAAVDLALMSLAVPAETLDTYRREVASWWDTRDNERRRQFLAKAGLPAETLAKAAESFGVAARWQSRRALTARVGLNSVPYVLINGRTYVTVSRGDYDRVDFLRATEALVRAAGAPPP